MRKGLIALSMLVASNATAQTCIPKPDCADMGYTKTSCSGAYLKCPFDTSKMACLADAPLTGCYVGYIYYSDKTCSNNVISGKTPIGVVVKENAVVLSQMRSSLVTWGSRYTDVSGVVDTTSDTALLDYNGKSNTAAIVAACSSDTTSNNAAKYCNSYSTTGTSVGQWYLPAAGELYSYVYGNYNTITTTASKLGWTYSSGYYWSSSERGDSYAWSVHTYDGNVASDYKGYGKLVSCFLEI